MADDGLAEATDHGTDGGLPSADPRSLGFSPARLRRLTGALQEDIAHGRLPGAVALIARDGRLAYFEAMGALGPAPAPPMPKDAIFRIYSMTKPIVSVAAMMLAEEGRLLISDPVAKYIPAFANPKVAVFDGDRLTLVDAVREISIQDLLRHTSGLGYAFTGASPMHRLYAQAPLSAGGRQGADFVAQLAALPLFHQPGASFEYSHSTDVLGHIVATVAGASLRDVLMERIFRPLGMTDTDFFTTADGRDRLAQPFPTDPDSGADVKLFATEEVPAFQSGGGGLVSTAADYLRFCQMLLDGGRFGGARLLSRKTVEYMTADHLGDISSQSALLEPGHGFGLGFAVRLTTGIGSKPLSAGSYFWGGIAGTTFWIDPAERLIAMLLVQAPGRRDYVRGLFRSLVYAAFDD